MGCLEIIESVSSTKIKESLLQEFMEDPDFTQILQMTYDIRHTYGIKKIEYSPNKHSVKNWDIGTYGLLEGLTSRALSGNAATEAVVKELEQLSPSSSKLLYRVLQRDLLCGINATSINNAVSNTIYKPGYMRCSLPDQKYLDRFEWERGIYCQLKADGMFVNVNVSDAGCVLTSRRGHILPKNMCNILEKSLEKLSPNYQYHGELLVKHRSLNTVYTYNRKEGNGIINHLVKGTGKLPPEHWLSLDLWDMILSEEEDKRIYEERLEELSYLLEKKNNSLQKIETTIVRSYSEAEAWYKHWRSLGFEGAVIKNPKGLWKNGTSFDQLKVKPTKTCELIAIVMNPGKESGRNVDSFGSLLCVSECGNLAVNVAGFNDEERAEVSSNWSKYKEGVVSVKFTETIQDKRGVWSLSNPRFLEWRLEEKDTADTLVYIKKL